MRRSRERRLKLAHYVRRGDTRVGIVRGDEIFDLAEAAGKSGVSELSQTDSIDSILERGVLEKAIRAEEKLTKAASGVPLRSTRLRPPILSPEKILLVAVNYLSHGKETNVAPPPYPHFFTKFTNTLIGPDDTILLPKVSQKVDWEVELAVVIGRTGKYIKKQRAFDHVAGYTISNDISFRDFQLPPGWPEKVSPLGLNWVKGKGLDYSFPLGPWLVTRDEIGDPHDLEISLAVNGQTRQRSRTSDMVFKSDALIEYISAGITLRPGDIISTGTPLGVALATGVPFLKDGDVVEGRIEKIGTLRNHAKRET